MTPTVLAGVICHKGKGSLLKVTLVAWLIYERGFKKGSNLLCRRVGSPWNEMTCLPGVIPDDLVILSSTSRPHIYIFNVCGFFSP